MKFIFQLSITKSNIQNSLKPKKPNSCYRKVEKQNFCEYPNKDLLLFPYTPNIKSILREVK